MAEPSVWQTRPTDSTRCRSPLSGVFACRQRAMAQFAWHDGSVRNVHVDMAQLFEYQKQLGATVRLYEQRLDWLSTSSRRIFGTVAEKK